MFLEVPGSLSRTVAYRSYIFLYRVSQPNSGGSRGRSLGRIPCKGTPPLHPSDVVTSHQADITRHGLRQLQVALEEGAAGSKKKEAARCAARSGFRDQMGSVNSVSNLRNSVW